MSKYNWINDDVKIDFVLPKILQDKILELEELDKNMDDRYFDVCEYLDDDAKGYYVEGIISKKQWDVLVKRYDGSI